jgi:hypothetical protein
MGQDVTSLEQRDRYADLNSQSLSHFRFLQQFMNMRQQLDPPVSQPSVIDSQWQFSSAAPRSSANQIRTLEIHALVWNEFQAGRVDFDTHRTFD